MYSRNPLSDPDLLTEQQKEWFGDRITESHTGRVLIPTYLYTKFKKIVGNEFLINQHIKSWLIDNVYNSK
ncbi:hypothetical protein NVP1083O_56 [Vibrio phage 1.083.O._10N.286.52.B9]|nr:hypothetical protein NVP1083O_56 [Vibrio phage 1.083.O._10N.286.52.B9]